MAFNLISQLTELDKKRLENYLCTYELSEGMISMDTLLQHWGKEKIKLYKLLGNQFIYKFPISIEKDQDALEREIYNLVCSDSFVCRYRERINSFFTDDDYDNRANFRDLVYYNTILTESVGYSIKYKKDENSKLLQFQKGMKPIRALQKTVDYFEWTDLKDDLENFRNKLSLITNDKMLKGNLCLSIHPQDFFTLSDNNEGWSSCFSVIERGCYHISCEELLNSNNALVIYLESKEDWNFSKENKHAGEDWTWNSKRFRQHCIITKDIIVNGKGYPYQSEKMTALALEKVKELAGKNLGWTYEYGLEEYRDMNHLGSNRRMEIARQRINYKEFKDNNDKTHRQIIIDSKGLYNDWFNDNDTRRMYWCYRNKIKHTKMISISGKTTCLSCGEPAIEWDDSICEYTNYEGAYNDRYKDCSHLLCRSCARERRCDECHTNALSKVYTINGKHYCESCLKKLYKICPDCGKPFFINDEPSHNLYARISDSTIYVQDFYRFRYSYTETGLEVRYNNRFDLINNKDREEIENKAVQLHMCNDCRNSRKGSFPSTNLLEDEDRIIYTWQVFNKPMLSKEIFSVEDVKKFTFPQLESVDLSTLG